MIRADHDRSAQTKRVFLVVLKLKHYMKCRKVGVFLVLPRSARTRGTNDKSILLKIFSTYSTFHSTKSAEQHFSPCDSLRKRCQSAETTPRVVKNFLFSTKKHSTCLQETWRSDYPRICVERCYQIQICGLSTSDRVLWFKVSKVSIRNSPLNLMKCLRRTSGWLQICSYREAEF